MRPPPRRLRAQPYILKLYILKTLTLTFDFFINRKCHVGLKIDPPPLIVRVDTVISGHHRRQSSGGSFTCLGFSVLCPFEAWLKIPPWNLVIHTR
jgi:hypothetical protein